MSSPTTIISSGIGSPALQMLAIFAFRSECDLRYSTWSEYLSELVSPAEFVGHWTIASIKEARVFPDPPLLLLSVPLHGRMSSGRHSSPLLRSQVRRGRRQVRHIRTGWWKRGTHGCSRASLAPGHSVDLVIHADNRDVDVSPAGMDEVVAADGRKVPVTGKDDDMESGFAILTPVANASARPWVVWSESVTI